MQKPRRRRPNGRRRRRGSRNTLLKLLCGIATTIIIARCVASPTLGTKETEVLLPTGGGRSEASMLSRKVRRRKQGSFGTLHRHRRIPPRSFSMRDRPSSSSRSPEPSPSPARQIAAFIAKFDPKVASLIRACRSALRKKLPTAIELVYDNYNFLAIGFSTSERTSDCICSLACAANGVALSFYYGASLQDPDGVLLGSGKQNRYVRLPTAATLREPAVAALIDAAVKNAASPLPQSGRGKTIVKSVSARQRPRRAKATSEVAVSKLKASAAGQRPKPARAKRTK